MHRFLQKYSKKIMAVLSIVLMVIFVVQSTSSSTGRSTSDGIVGHMGDVDLYNSDLQRAKNEWEMLAKNVYVAARISPFPGIPAQVVPIPLVHTLGAPEPDLQHVYDFSEDDVKSSRQLVQEIHNNPDLYLLLKKEAQQMGVQINVDRFESALRNEFRVLVGGTQLIAASDLNRDAVETQQLRYAILQFMQVQAAFERAASAIKISTPQRNHEVAKAYQRLTMDLIQFSDADYEVKVPPPTTQQVEEQFKTYADVSPGLASKSNPFGFGYKYPDRVKLQYIQVPRADLLTAAETKRKKDEQSRYEWKKDAYVFYTHNQEVFATTQPVAATTQSTFSVANLTGNSTSPTTQPFDQVVDRAEHLVILNDADKLATTIETRMNSILNEDYIAYNRALSSEGTGTTNPAIPNSTLGVPYASYAYLERLAQVIQKEFGVLPQTTALDHEFHSEKDLSDLKGIGAASYKSIPFAQYAIAYAKPLSGDDQLHTEAQAIELWEPSQPLRDDRSDVYIFRLTAAEKSHAPASASEVLSQIQSDLRSVGAFQLAQADAAKFLQNMKIPAGTLASAATASGKKIIEVGPFGMNSPIEAQGFSLTTPAAQSQFLDEAFGLLSMVDPKSNPHPIKQIDLPAGQRVLIAQLKDVLPLWHEGQLPYVEWAANAQDWSRGRHQFAADWFDFDSVAARLNYRSEGNKQRRPAPPPPVDKLG